eukprot:TRINITY_DN501_c0_g1_i1.p1 TRINITY_DN501_c0_g1~~TRINITY_DN501_c0_g1_i1.p1  ORF type:complete len:142 (-),score=5.22 TRINITY_DN501_c0_g1_i1:105-530(-)
MSSHTNSMIYMCEVPYSNTHFEIDVQPRSRLSRIVASSSIKNLVLGTNDIWFNVIAQNEVNITHVSFLVVRRASLDSTNVATLIDLNVTVCGIVNFRTNVAEYSCTQKIPNANKVLTKGHFSVRPTDPKAKWQVQNYSCQF